MNSPTQHGGIIAWFAVNPVAANLLMLLIMALGLMEMGNLRKEAFPSMEPNTITITVNYDSGSAVQTEEGIAIKIEEQLQGVNGIKSITSTSTGNNASVTVEKRSDYDLEQLQQDVRAKVDAISTFPAEAKNPVIEKGRRQEHALWLQLYGDADRHTLQQLANNLKADLLERANISEVDISGWLDPAMVVEIDEARLQAYDLTFSDVEDAINRSSTTTRTAVLRNESTYLQLEAAKQAYTARDFADLPLITSSDGRQLRIGDVALVRDTFDDSSSVLSRYNYRDSIALQVIASDGEDIAGTVDAARDVIEQWHQDGLLPDNIKLDSWYDRSQSINGRLQLLGSNALTGIILVFIVLALFLNLQVAFWVAAGLPVICLGTLYFMGDSALGLGLTLNEFTTLGFILALGIVVDDAIVVGESVYTRRSTDGDTLHNTVRGTLDVAKPTLFGIFTTVVAFSALSNVSGMLGELYAQFAVIVTLCLLLSMVESKLILPAHLSHLNTRKQRSKNALGRYWSKLQRGADRSLDGFNRCCYTPAIRWALEQRYAVVVLFSAVFLLVISMPFSGSVRFSFFPDVPGETITAQLTMVKDASFGLTHANLNRMELQAYETDSQLRAELDQGAVNKSGVEHLQLMSQGDQSGEITVQLAVDAPYDEDSFTRRWRQLIGQPEGARTVTVFNNPQMTDALRIELRASDDEALSRAGAAFKEKLAAIAGVTGIEDNLEPGQPKLNLALNQQGRALGLSTGELSRQVLQAFSGQIVQRYQRSSDEIEVTVRYPESSRQNSADVQNARVRTADGSVIPLSSVTDISYGYTRDSITRIDSKRAVYISADVDKNTIPTTQLVAQLKSSVAPELLRQFPRLDIHFGGEAEQQAETQSSMMQVFVFAMLAIYILLAIPLKSYFQPLLILTAIPFGIVGAILGHWINDIALGILSLNGIIALAGVAVNDSLLLVSRFNEIRDRCASLPEAIIEACRSRLRAVLLTSVTTYAGLMPLLSETSFQAQFLKPAAVSLGYGILFATVITLILIPALLYIQHDIQALLKKITALTLGGQTEQQPGQQQC